MASAIEMFGPPVSEFAGIRLDLGNLPAPSRAWFTTVDGSELVQVQHDRFALNWSQNPSGDEYPRYGWMRSKFEEKFRLFTTWVRNAELGPVELNQCELTYVNHIASGKGWETYDQLADVFTVWNSPEVQPQGALIENANFALRYRFFDDNGEPLGRLHVESVPAQSIETGSPLFVLTLTARGRPDGSDFEACLATLDRAHALTVRTFMSITTAGMHQIWGLQHD